MPINKADFEILRKNRVPFEIIPRDVAQSISNPDALAIWVYLLTKPDNWIVRKEEIKTHFSLGRDRYSAAMKELRRLGLLVTAHVRNPETGHLDGTVMWVNASITEIPDFRHLGESDMSENPTSRENSTLKDIQRELKNTDRPSNAGFDAFWQAYPKRVEKKKAQELFKRLPAIQQRMAIDDIRSGRYAGTDKRFIPNPTTYLRGERWEDERTDAPQTQNTYAGAI